MKQFLITSALLLSAAAVPLLADAFSITVTITATSNPTIPVGTYQGSFTTNDTCILCTTTVNGGIVSFDVPINTGNLNITPTVLPFDAVDSLASVTYNTATKFLSGDPDITMTTKITASPSSPYFTGYVVMEMTPTTLNTPPANCDSQDHTVGTGCVSIRPTEGSLASGTYVITAQPAAGGCPATIGFWKHHAFPEPLKTSGLTIAGTPYTPAQLLTILNNNGGNAVVILGRQLVGTLINLAAGGVHNIGADAAVASAQSLLQTNALNLLSSNVPPSTQLGAALVAQGSILDGYNNADYNTCREGSGLVTGSK